MGQANGTSRSRNEILDLLADRDFARVWGAGALLGIVRWLEALAVGIFVIDLTGSASAVAFVGFMRMLPMVLFGAFAGTLGARFDRRRLLTVGSVIGGACAVLLGALAWSGAIAVWQIAAGSFLTGILWTADFPIRRTLLADIAGPSRIGAAMSADSFNNHGTRLLGAAAGGLLIGSLGLVGAYLICAALYMAVVYLLWRVRHTDAPAPPPTANLLRETVDGFRVIVAERFLVAVLAVTLIFNFFRLRLHGYGAGHRPRGVAGRRFRHRAAVVHRSRRQPTGHVGLRDTGAPARPGNDLCPGRAGLHARRAGLRPVAEPTGCAWRR